LGSGDFVCFSAGDASIESNLSEDAISLMASGGEETPHGATTVATSSSAIRCIYRETAFDGSAGTKPSPKQLYPLPTSVSYTAAG
jgi:hypothetical protein